MTTGSVNGASPTNNTNATNDGQSLYCDRLIDHSLASAHVSSSDSTWYSINDNVMGGKSLGTFSENNDHLHFHGSINTNGGGFASIRKDISTHQFIGADRIRLAVQSDGRAYSVQLQDASNQQQATSHRAPFSTSGADKYEVIDISLKDLVPTFRGRRIQSEPLNTTTVRTIGIMLSDAIDGPFSLKLRWIEVCRIREKE